MRRRELMVKERACFMGCSLSFPPFLFFLWLFSFDLNFCQEEGLGRGRRRGRRRRRGRGRGKREGRGGREAGILGRSGREGGGGG